MAEISYTNTVNVNISGVPMGLSDFVTANIGLFTNEIAGFSDEYKVYISASGVEEDFGSDSLTYKMAAAAFSQSPNLRSGGGSLIVAPYSATDGSCSTLTGGTISDSILSSIKSVKKGILTYTDNSVTTVISNLDFRSVKTIEDIALIIENKNPDVSVSVESKKIKLTSKNVGTNLSVIASTIKSGDNTTIDIGGASYLGLIDATSVAGSKAVDVESLPTAATRISKKIYFGGILDTCIRDNDSIVANAAAIESMSKKVYVEVTNSLKNIEVLGKAILDATNKKTRILAYSNGDMKAAKCMTAAYLSKALCTNYNGSNTCITMNLKELSTIAADTNCSDSTLAAARANGVDIYGSTSGLSCVYSSKNAGGYMDDQTGLMAFVGQLEVAAFNYLKQTNTKVPQTEAGMTGLKNSLADVCVRFVNNGFIGTGLTWNSSEKFGDVEDFDSNIYNNGYYIYSLPISEQAQSERESRTAPLIQLAAKSAGAIHIININGTIEA